jgi:cyclophilin family peptidyl-prolyl cis-trans isomerase
MMRQIRLISLFLLAGAPFLNAEMLVGTRLHPEEAIASGTTFQIDLRDYFQHFSEPGPVATFAIRMPVQAGWMELNFADGSLTAITGQTLDDQRFMTYELEAGGTYANVYDAYTEDLKWIEDSVQFQLLAEEAPISVANFMTYADMGSYTDTIVHRNEPSLSILQAGGFKLEQTADYYFSYIDTLPSIPLEQTRVNSAGTIAMARQSLPNTATSQFFINLQDNSQNLGRNYCVFGELIDMGTALPLITQMGDAWVYNLTQFLGGTFLTTPLFTPYYNDRDSYIRFPTITVSEGNPDGVSYAWEWLDTDGEDGTSEEEQAARDLFDVQLDGSSLSVARTGSTGVAAIKVTGTSASGTSEFEIELIAMNPGALDKFPSSTIYGDGWISNIWYGWLIADDYPLIRHYNHGYQYVSEASTTQTMYIYDYRLGSWLYTRSSLYPYFYAYARDGWIWYQKDSGNGADLARFFYDYTILDWFTDEQ